MPLVANSPLPSFDRLRQEGATVIPDDFALRQNIRELHIGLLNMMPDAALEATERQFFRLIGESNQIAQFYVHPFTLPEIDRSYDMQRHIARYYRNFSEIREEGLDALIVTGANVVGSELSEQPFLQPLSKVMDWAYENVTSSLCSCLATHAVLEFRYQQKRQPLPQKRWGVYSHSVTTQHPLVAGVNTRFDVPHSRFNDISRQQFEATSLKVLVESQQAGVHIAVSEDGFRTVFFQGHPEYDKISLLKEYKREIGRYIHADTMQYPVFPENYFSACSCAIMEEYKDRIDTALRSGEEPPLFPEKLIIPSLDNTWHDTAEAVINNWIGKVYQLSHIDRHKAFDDSVDANNPLQLEWV